MGIAFSIFTAIRAGTGYSPSSRIRSLHLQMEQTPCYPVHWSGRRYAANPKHEMHMQETCSAVAAEIFAPDLVTITIPEKIGVFWIMR